MNNSEKQGLHPRNKHRFLYDFLALIADFPALKSFISINKYGNDSVDYANPDAVKALNQALLKHFYGIENWDIPGGYLCPPIPGRAEYIHHISDFLTTEKGEILRGSQVRILDIGVGANCIYPIIGHREYGWHFVGSDVDVVSIQSAEKIAAENSLLKGAIACRLQPSKSNIFKNIIQPDDFFDCTMCNPPFHASILEATKGTERKINNLGRKIASERALNFGGQYTELSFEGGELAFIKNMISESIEFKNQCRWFSTLISKNENLPKIVAALRKEKIPEIEVIHLAFGNKLSRILFWSFVDKKGLPKNEALSPDEV